MRVLLVAPDPALTLTQQGGAGTHLRGTIAGLEANGVEVVPVIGGASASASVAQRPAPRARRIAPQRVRGLARDLRLLAHGRSFPSDLARGVDCVYERSAYLLDVGRPLAQAARIPYLVESDGLLVEARRAAYGAPLGRYGELLERRKLRDADRVVVMAEAQRAQMADQFGVDPARVVVKGLGVDAALLERPPAPPPPVLRVGFAGTFQPYHGAELLVAAARLLPDAEVVLVGDGPRYDAVRASAPAEARIRFTGRLPREAALDALADCSVLVVPDSARHLYPVKLLEYAALGRSVVCPDYPAFDEFVRDGESLVYRFAPGSAEALAAAIERAAGDAGQRAEALRLLVAREYTWEACGRRLAAALSTLVA